MDKDVVTARAVGNKAAEIARDESCEFKLGQWYMFKCRVSTGSTVGPNRYRVKIWPKGEVEPAIWSMDAPGTDGELSSGSVALCAHHADVTYGSVSINPL